MMTPFDTALLRHKADRHALPDGHLRALRGRRRAGRLRAFAAFLSLVFAQPPRHPVRPVVPAE